MLKQLGITSVLSTAYHLQTDGTTEWVNQEIKTYLAIYCYSHLETWKRSILTLKFTHNHKRHADQPKTPFELIMGNSPKAIPKVFKNTKFLSIDDRLGRSTSGTWTGKKPNSRTKEKHIYCIWKRTKSLVGYLKHENYIPKKMTPKQEGPFKNEEVLGPVTYQLKLPNTWKVHNMFHVVLLKPYQENKVYGENFPTPPLEIINGEEVYQVETILKHRKRGQEY